LKSVISQIRTISAGKAWAMGNSWLKNNSRHDSNWLRGWDFESLGNGVGFISIKDKRQKFGICMDMLMVDVTEIDCTEGDRNYFGENPTVSYIAKKLNTIPMRF
jgi:alanine racemase